MIVGSTSPERSDAGPQPRPRASSRRDLFRLLGMAGAGPLPYTVIKALGPRYRTELEEEVELAMDSLGDPDDAFRYHHSYLLAVAEKR